MAFKADGIKSILRGSFVSELQSMSSIMRYKIHNSGFFHSFILHVMDFVQNGPNIVCNVLDTALITY